MYGKDGPPRILGWKSEQKFPIETPRSTQGWIDCINPVGCSYYDYLTYSISNVITIHAPPKKKERATSITSVVQPIHHSKQGGHNRTMNLILFAGSDRSQSCRTKRNVSSAVYLFYRVCSRLPSISSKKIIEGSIRLACSNSSRNWRSASPTHLLRQSAPFRIKKETFVPD